ncbi:MAG: molybdopterin-dependent aldehyde oxidoreductase [Candidatus Scatomorpha sp.]|jgi:aldehyde oxidoreductase
MAAKKKTWIINGVEKMFIFDAERDRLSDVLRNMGYTGVKVGCAKGVCGACTVLVNGEVAHSCAKKADSLPDYTRVETIEGLGTAEHLHPLQLAWMVYGGVQCGFCTPGFIMSAKGLLDKNPNPTREEVRAHFQKNRNACRCTGYKQLVDAVMAAAKVMRGEMTMDELAWKIPEDGRIYGTNIPRPAALAKVLGQCDYGGDMERKMPSGTLYLAVVQPGCSHALIKGIDSSEAEKAPGVAKVITAADVKGMNCITFPLGHPRAKGIGFDQPTIAKDRVNYYGDVVAVVAADTPCHARDAAKLVKLDLEPLPEYTDALLSSAPDAEEIHPGMPNNFIEVPVFHGRDTREVLAESDYVAEGSFYSTREPHLTIEPDTAQAYVDADGILTIHCKTLGVHLVMATIAAGLGYPMEKIRIVENPTGASFGYSMSPAMGGLVGACTLALGGRPVSLTMSYEEHQHFSGKRAASYSNARIGCDKDGKLTALEFEMTYDKGAYTQVGAGLAEIALRFFGMPYAYPNAMGLSRAIVSNHAYSTAYRGWGSPQCYTASEQLIDMLAEKAGIDPFEFRYRNVYRPGDTSINGHGFDVYPWVEIMDKMRPIYEKLKAHAAANSTPEKRLGVGIACGMYNVTASPDNAMVALELNPDGSVTLYNTWEDQGQGGDVGSLVHAHEALRPLGLRPDQIKLVMNDTAICPPSGMAASSRSHYMIGLAIIDAANQLMAAMKKPDGSWRSYDEMAAEGIATKYMGKSSTADRTSALDPNNGQGNPSAEYSYAGYLAEVEVDTATGKARTVAMHCVADVGVIGNRAVVDGQAYGGMMHSIGFALSEDYSDVKKHANILGAGFPYIESIPDGENFTVDYVETPRPTGPNGSSGCAEAFQSCDHAAVLNAIYNAVGVRIYELPATAEKIKAALDAKARGEELKPARYYFGKDFYEALDEMRANPVETKKQA